ncbi:acyl-CoA/acyl-ACP dehydrogenase [Micromonospora sp. BRA006-A]|uniref:acyl-CoA dehydrogenase family protein n=1 Tax=Micromonospora sp. BRA006-A TaxID=2962860 RepID=UPI00296FCA8D|nr:acyl-CoA dehydrogenase family protein [Micromonospora sp. BRA006-A]MDW3848657.1 acyl-CoA/acyl-ACP dehydrogenase [Micromonospora sp. BRA006-A]
MVMETASRPWAGDLDQPVTAPGAELLRLISAHLPQISAGAAAHDRAGTFPAEAFENLRKDGVLGATVPRELGGLGVTSLHDVALTLRRVGAADGSAALALHMQLSRALTLTYEWQHGAPAAAALAERMLRAMGSGEAVVCTTVKDAVAHRVVSRLTPGEPGEWVLNGRKMLATMAPIATTFVISARTKVPGAQPEQVAVVLDRNTPGLSVCDDWDGLGMRASGSVDIVMQDCVVPERDVFFRGPVGDRDDAALAGQTVSSITMLGIYLGIAGAARDLAVATVRQRGSGQAGARTLIVEVDAKLQAMRATTALALAEADAPPAGEPAVRGRRLMTSFQRAKLVVNRLAPEIVGDCMTLVGGASFVAGHPLARLARDARAGSFMHPFTYADGVDFLSRTALED